MLCVLAASRATTGQEGALRDRTNEVNTYCMVPLPPKTAAQLHVTVNGIWGGVAYY